MKTKELILVSAGLATGLLFGKLAESRDPERQNAEQTGQAPALRGTPRDIAKDRSRLSNTSALYDSITACVSSDFPSMAGQILSLPADSLQRMAALDLLMEHWVHADFAAALTFAATLRGEDRGLAFKSALTRLGENRFDETLAWMNTNLSPSVRHAQQMWLFSGLARVDPRRSLAEIEELSPGKPKDDVLHTVVNQWAQNDIAGALDWFRGASWDDKTMDLYNRLMRSYIDQHPDEARGFIAGMEDGDYWKGRYSQDLVRSMAAADPAKALEISAGVADSRLKDSAYTSLFEQWSADDPRAAFAEALSAANDTTLAASTKNTIARQAAFAMLHEDRTSLLADYARLPQDIRNEIAGPVVSQWMAEDPDAALTWAAKFERDSPESNLALSAAATHYQSWNPEAAIATANRITYEDIRRDSLYTALQHLYRQNPSRAAEIAADTARVNPDIKTSFDRWVTETGEEEMEFLNRGK